MVEEQIEQDARSAPPFGGKARAGGQHRRMAVGEGIDAPVQADGGLDVGAEATAQRSLDPVRGKPRPSGRGRIARTP